MEIYDLLVAGQTVIVRYPNGHTSTIRPEFYGDVVTGYSVIEDGQMVGGGKMIDRQMHPYMFNGLEIVEASKAGEVER